MFRIVISTGCWRLASRLASTKTLYMNTRCRTQTVRSLCNGFNRIPKQLSVRYYNDDSASKIEKLSAKERIHSMITNSSKRVFVFMKGIPERPECGYSNAVVQILQAYQVDFDSCNVLTDPEIRQEVKAYSNWPTIPQVYINGSFIGGCDILIQMHQNNELEKLFEDIKSASESNLVNEEEIPVSNILRKEPLKEAPIKSLDIVKHIEKVSKKGSFTVDLFKGQFDDDYLTYPDPLYDRKQNQELKDQATMVRGLYPQIWDDERQLQKFNFFNLYQLSVSEMMTIFEAIGASSRDCTQTQPTLPASEVQHTPQIQVSKSMISLVIRNCLTYWPMDKSKSERIRDLLPQKHILFGGSKDEKSLNKSIGFCWTETAPELGSIPPQEWQTLGERGGLGDSSHLIKGKKTRVLYDGSIENYLVYYRDKFLSEKYEVDAAADEPNPASDPFIGCSLLHKSQLKFGPVYIDSAGCQYVDIEIDAIVPHAQSVFFAERLDPTGVNIKALGQLATCSIVLGMLKDSLKLTYQHLVNSKKGLLDCNIIQRKLSTVTSRIFALESMVYYIAGMYDGLEHGFDAHMESTILKIITNEYAYECLKEIQDICSSDMLIVSRIQDQVNIFDAFLDGNVYNRLYLASMGIIWYARSKNMHLNQLRLAPWYPGYFIKNMIRERAERGDMITLNADIFGSMHPALYDAGVDLEYILKRVKHAAESVVLHHGKDATHAQDALYKLAKLSVDAFTLTTICARASKSYSNGTRNCEIDLNIATTFARSLSTECRLLIEELDTMPINYINTRCSEINELNMKAGGYYAESPLDVNI